VLAVDPTLINNAYKAILDQFLLDHDPVRITPQKAKKDQRLYAMLTLISSKDPDAGACDPHIKRRLVESLQA